MDVLQAQARKEGPGSEGQGFGFNVCVVPRDVHGVQLAQRDEGLSHNGEEQRECYSWYRLPLYAYLIRRTGTFVFLNSNLAMPLFPNATPLFYIRYKHLCFYL